MSNVSNAKSPGNRYGWVDIAKGIAILLVVYRHVFEGLSRANLDTDNYPYLQDANILFFSFRMPLFFIVSGLFVGSSLAKRTFQQFFLNKTGTILYPFLLWGCLQIGMQIIFSHYTNSNRTAWAFVDLFLSPRRIDQFWYLYALFNVSIIYAFLKSRLKVSAQNQLAIGFVAFFVSGIITKNNFNVGFVYDILHYYIFMAIGDAVSTYMFNPVVQSRLMKRGTLLALLPFFIITQYLFLTLNNEHGDANYLEHAQLWIYFPIAIVGAFFVIVSAMQLQQSTFGNWVSTIGRYSLQVYVMHVLVSSVVRTILTKFIGIQQVPLVLFICISFGVLLPILFASVAEKLGMKWLFQWNLEKYFVKNKDLAVTK